MKKLLLATSAFFAWAVVPASAADIAPLMVTKAPQKVWDWTGLYLGGYAGVGVQQSHALDPTGTFIGEIDHAGSGFTGGGTAGYNWQFGRNWVVGVEGDVGHLGLGHTGKTYNNNLTYDSKTSWIATLRGRLGWSNGPTLSYVTGGGAWVKVEDHIEFTGGGAPRTSSKTKSGYALGTGTETMLGGNWTAKAEYLFVDVGAGDTLTNGNIWQTDKHRYHVQKFGLNYLFGAAAQPALQTYNWTGFYVGLVGGGAVTSSRGSDPTGTRVGEIANNDSAYTVGGQAGYNWQFAPSFLVGVEGDFSWLGIDRATTLFDMSVNQGVKTSWLATLRGRFAYSTGPALLYVTGGGAWVNVRDDWTTLNPTITASSTKTLSGYTVGGGIETVLAGNWTMRTEYLYVDAGTGDTLVSNGQTIRVDHRFHLFRSGLAYRFSGG
jgi:outer membrane immunogenic protein